VIVATRAERRLHFSADTPVDPSLEWIVTNGIGGYASGPVRGGLTRRFHGALIASLPAPIGRLMTLNLIKVTALADGRETVLDHEDIGALPFDVRARLDSFVLENGLPVWHYAGTGLTFEKRIVMPYGQNTTYVIWRLTPGSSPCVLRIQPAFQIRAHEGRVDDEPVVPQRFAADGASVELDVAAGLPTIRWLLSTEPTVANWSQPAFLPVVYPVEQHRGYDFAGSIWTPGWCEVPLAPGQAVTFAVSTEPWASLRTSSADAVLSAEHRRRDGLIAAAGQPLDGVAAELTLAADQFIIAPVGRAEEVARIRATGDEPRSVIAGYHWFTDWGRDTMISLEGLALATGREREAGAILRTFAHHVRDGLIPNMFPEGAQLGLYHTADATLWFFHALHRYVQRSGDWATLTSLLPTLVGIAEQHVSGTRFGIGVDPADGLLRQGEDGYQLTWMDAKVGDWVVTPRRGKAVEINALWYNALSLLVRWLTDVGRAGDAVRWQMHSAAVAQSFNERFWNPETGHLYDVVDGESGDDPACRPNQLLAISLDHPVLAHDRWAAVLDVVRARLLTPVGLRSLAAGHKNYRSTYDGNLYSRDAAYHQGTVWPWLIGPFIDAWRRTYPEDTTGPRTFLAGFVDEIARCGVGTIGEINDAEGEYTSRGCISQAWSVAEVLRTWRAIP
jgi:predicted glycogen debranching enzyme